VEHSFGIAKFVVRRQEAVNLELVSLGLPHSGRRREPDGAQALRAQEGCLPNGAGRVDRHSFQFTSILPSNVCPHHGLRGTPPFRFEKTIFFFFLEAALARPTTFLKDSMKFLLPSLLPLFPPPYFVGVALYL